MSAKSVRCVNDGYRDQMGDAVHSLAYCPQVKGRGGIAAQLFSLSMRCMC